MEYMYIRHTCACTVHACKRPQFIFQIFFSWVWYDPRLTYFGWPSKVKLFWEVLDWTWVSFGPSKVKLPRVFSGSKLSNRYDLETSPKVGQFKVNQFLKINIWFYSCGLFCLYELHWDFSNYIGVTNFNSQCQDLWRACPKGQGNGKNVSDLSDGPYDRLWSDPLWTTNEKNLFFLFPKFSPTCRHPELRCLSGIYRWVLTILYNNNRPLAGRFSSINI